MNFERMGIFKRLSVAIREGTCRRVYFPVMRLKCCPGPKVQRGLLARGILNATGYIEAGVTVLWCGSSGSIYNFFLRPTALTLMRFQMRLQLLTCRERLVTSFSIALKRFGTRRRMRCSNVGSKLGMLRKRVLAAFLRALEIQKSLSAF